MNTQQLIQSAINKGIARVLTFELAKTLKGKHITTKYFGYKGQDGVDSFVVGDIVSEYELALNDPMEKFGNRAKYWESFLSPSNLHEKKNTFVLLTSDGRNTFIRCYKDWKYYFSEPTFTCSDADREVYFIVC